MTFNNFVIRPITADDVENYFLFIESNRERIAPYFPVIAQSTLNVESTLEYIKKRVQRAEKKEYITFVIVDIEVHKIIGAIFLKAIDWKSMKSEIGSFVDQGYEGKGIVSQGLSMAINHCFWVLELNKVFFKIHQDNLRSIRIAEKLGFTKEGVLRQDFKGLDGKYVDMMYYGLLKEDKGA